MKMELPRFPYKYRFALYAAPTIKKVNAVIDTPLLCISFGAEHIHFYDLRHTYITRLFESGLDIKEIQYLAGHTTVDMTLRVYTHYQHETRQQDTVNKVCAALG